MSHCSRRGLVGAVGLECQKGIEERTLAAEKRIGMGNGDQVGCCRWPDSEQLFDCLRFAAWTKLVGEDGEGTPAGSQRGSPRLLSWGRSLSRSGGLA